MRLWTLVAGMLIATALSASEEKIIVAFAAGEIQEMVDETDRRLQRGRYDDLSPAQMTDLVDSIASLRESLAGRSETEKLNGEVLDRANSFANLVLEIEEGGIVCKRISRVGSRMQEDRCYSRKRAEEDRRRSKEELAKLKRPQLLPRSN